MSQTNGEVKRVVEVPFIMVPLEIARHRELSGAAKLVLGVIYSLWHLPSGCTCTNLGLASRVGMSVKQIRRILQELERLEFIARTIENHGRGEIILLWRAKGRKIRTTDKLSQGGGGSPKLGGGGVAPSCTHPPPPKLGYPSKDEKKKGKQASSAACLPDDKKTPAADANREGSPPPAGKEKDSGEQASPDSENARDQQATPEEIAAWRRSLGLVGRSLPRGPTVFGRSASVIADIQDPKVQDNPGQVDPETEAVLTARANAKKAAAYAAMARRAKDEEPKP